MGLLHRAGADGTIEQAATVVLPPPPPRCRDRPRFALEGMQMSEPAHSPAFRTAPTVVDYPTGDGRPVAETDFHFGVIA